MEAVFSASINVFLKISSFPLSETNFLFIWNSLPLLRDFSLLVETGKSNFWKTTLFLLTGTDNVAIFDTPALALFFRLAGNVFSKSCIPVNGDGFCGKWKPIFFHFWDNPSSWSFFSDYFGLIFQQI